MNVATPKIGTIRNRIAQKRFTTVSTIADCGLFYSPAIRNPKFHFYSPVLTGDVFTGRFCGKLTGS
jgi:hypothetical protein